MVAWLSVTVSLEDRATAERIADALGVPLSWVVRDGIRRVAKAFDAGRAAPVVASPASPVGATPPGMASAVSAAVEAGKAAVAGAGAVAPGGPQEDPAHVEARELPEDAP